MITLRPHQVGAIQHIDKALSQVYKAILCVLPTGAGKCHGKDTPVLMYDGSVKMIQDVKIGDVLMGPDSKPRNVLDTTVGFGKLYKVTPVKGDSYIVNQNHILSLKQTGLKSAPKYPCQQGKDSIVNMPVEKYMHSSKYFKHTHKGWRTGVDWPELDINKQVLPPYLLGVWLGDGTTNRPDITTADPEIEEYIREYCGDTEQQLRVSLKPNNKASTYHITGRKTLDELRSVGVLGCKHIPDRYKLTSRKNRLELLAGILDSDGHLGNNYYDVVFKVKQLAEDTVFLARSLGFASYMTPCVKKCCNTGVSGEYFRLGISGDISIIPTKVARHAPTPRKQKKSVLVTGITVEEYGHGDYYGVTIDSDHLYLLGDFTVTHNSLTLAEYARRAYHNKELCVIFAHRDVLISQLSEALCKTGVPHTFICSDKARRDITNNNHIQFGDSYWEETSPVIVSSTPTFSARLRGGKLDSDFLSRVKWWLQDECFPAGTLVDGKPIETLRVGDYVTSYNENTGEFEKKRVTRLFVNDGHDTMCVIKIKGIDDVVCTLNHPIFTRRGWVPAFLLNEDDEVLIYGNRGKMHNLWVPGSSGLSVQKIHVHKDGSGLLLCGLFNGLSFNNQLGDDDSDESEILLRTDEKKQPDEAKRVSGKDERNPRQDRTSSKCERWKRKTADCSRKSTSVQVGTSGFFTRDLCENTRISSGVQCSTCIQSRLRKPGVEIGNRGRRVQSLCKIETEAGREENNVSFFSRLDSVEIYQRTDTDKHGRNYDFDYVYNIEVEDNHTYIVNCLVVHNCHHCIDGNQWHTCLSSMPNATGIGFTATPIRGDKKGLGSHADGIFDYLSCTVNMWDLIQAGMLAPYRIFAHGKIDVTGIKRDSNGDLNTKQLRIKTKEADITGDAVEQYRKHLNGKPVITFCINIDHAKEVADEFNTAGIPSIAVSSKQPLAERQRAMDMMRDGRILNLVNVDLLGEGYDCPAVAGVIMMRRTVSYSLFKQQFGRMLRLADGKKYGILIDMVGNTRYMMETFRLHYPHDDPDWTLDRLSDKKIKECPACHSEKFFDGKCRECGYIDEESQYESMECRECGAFGVVGTEPVKDMLVFINGVCPECGHVETEEEKIARVREIKVQAGDLEEQNFDLIDELLAKRESLYVSVTDFAKKLPDHLSFKRSAVNNHATRQSNLDILRHWIQKWSEQMWEITNMSPVLIQTEFELTFGVNVLRCQADYTASQMDELTRKIQQHMRVIA